MDVGACSTKQLGDRFIDQRFPCLGASFVAADHVFVIVVQYNSMLSASASGCTHRKQQRKKCGDDDAFAIHEFDPSNEVRLASVLQLSSVKGEH